MSLDQIAVLSSCGPDSVPFLTESHRQHPWRVVLRVVPGEYRAPSRPRPWTVSRVSQAIERRLFYRFYYPHLDRRIGQAFSDSEPEMLDLSSLAVEVIDIPHHEVNSPATAALLRERDIDLLVVHAAPILKPVLFTAPRWGAVNIHYGIAPWFRGENTLFWALYQRAYQHLGITIHRINAGIDAGPPLCQGFPSLSANDDEVSLFAKSCRLAAELVPQLLREWDPAVPLPTSVGGGRNFNMRDRRVGHDLEYQFRRLLGERLPVLSERRVLFYREGQAEVDRDLEHTACV